MRAVAVLDILGSLGRRSGGGRREGDGISSAEARRRPLQSVTSGYRPLVRVLARA